MTEKILTQEEFTTKLAAAALYYEAFDDEVSARQIADLVLLSIKGRVLGPVTFGESDGEDS